jgi:hypothetical protein
VDRPGWRVGGLGTAAFRTREAHLRRLYRRLDGDNMVGALLGLGRVMGA